MRYHASNITTNKTADRHRDTVIPVPPLRTPSNWVRVRHTAVGYAKNRATALVASADTGVTTSINNGKVISPPPPADALIAPARMVAMKNKKYAHARSHCRKADAEVTSSDQCEAGRVPLPRQRI